MFVCNYCQSETEKYYMRWIAEYENLITLPRPQKAPMNTHTNVLYSSNVVRVYVTKSSKLSHKEATAVRPVNFQIDEISLPNAPPRIRSWTNYCLIFLEIVSL